MGFLVLPRFVTNLISGSHTRFTQTHPLSWSSFSRKGLYEWVLPLMRGFVQISTIRRISRDYDIVLISRRSRHRAGTRYHTRGVDHQGDVANFIETEQLVSRHVSNPDVKVGVSSFAQIRGSIPLLWEQSGKKYTPVPKINQDQALNVRRR